MAHSVRDEMRADIAVHVQPRAKKTEVAGWHGDAVKIRVGAPPVGGAANAELARFLAEAACVSRSAVQIVGGAASRRKRVAVQGISTAHLLRALGLT